MSKLNTIVPTNIFNFIAIQAAGCPDYDCLVALIETQIMDPVTGLSRGEKMPGLNGLGAEKATEETEEYLVQMGLESSSEIVAQIIAAAQAKGKSKGKGSGKTRQGGGEADNPLKGKALSFRRTYVNPCMFQQLSVFRNWWVPVDAKEGLGFSACILTSFSQRAVIGREWISRRGGRRGEPRSDRAR